VVVRHLSLEQWLPRNNVIYSSMLDLHTYPFSRRLTIIYHLYIGQTLAPPPVA
jgi:hypothetical protein